MAIHVEKLKDEPIIVHHYPEKLSSNQDIRDAITAEYAIFASLPDPIVWVIHDTSRLTIDFGTLISALVTVTREGQARPDDPRLRVAAVSRSELLKLAARSASQRQYGGWQVSIFDTYEQALTHARRDLAQHKEQG